MPLHILFLHEPLCFPSLTILSGKFTRLFSCFRSGLFNWQHADRETFLPLHLFKKKASNILVKLENKWYWVRFEVLTAVTIFWDVTLCNLKKAHLRFGEIYFSHLEGERVN
jgi:hypothetical protein